MLKLRCKVQHYEWGRIGGDSEVARLHALSSGETIDQQLPYAELWMGTHPSGPSSVMLECQDHSTKHQILLLKEWLEEHPKALGAQVQQRWEGGSDLPFLFKVLSVAKALSIQAHPDKELAKKLHSSYPDIYTDDNHKPEMALALTQFEALCGFVSSEELKQALDTVPELRSVLGECQVQDLMNQGQNRRDQKPDGTTNAVTLKAAFTTLMTLAEEIVAKSVSELALRLGKETQVRKLTPKGELVLRLERQYPADVGVLSVFFLNYLKLAPGEAVYLNASEPHAYVSGEIVECMAASDNVVRAGLTPKFRDTKTLCSMLTYKQGRPPILLGIECAPFTRRYAPPLDEFEVDFIVLPVSRTTEINSVGPSILLIFDGFAAITHASSCKVSFVQKGDIFFLPAGERIVLAAIVRARCCCSSNSCCCNDSRTQGEQQQQLPLQVYRAGVSSNELTRMMPSPICSGSRTSH